MHHDDFTKGKRGEFKGDFSRDTFDPQRHYSRVLTQQGRVMIDADTNERESIQTYYHRWLCTNLIGPHGAPADVDGNPGNGFGISNDESPFLISAGHYYVNGLLCENNRDILYHEQPDYPVEVSDLEATDYLVYLDVWERHVSHVEDDYMREKALGSVDTSSRSQIVWQVKVIRHSEFTELGDFTPANFKDEYRQFVAALEAAEVAKPGTGLLRARARKPSAGANDPCLIQPDAQYRGAENQLYRIEIHHGNRQDATPTFKWSRENASVIFPIIQISGNTITLQHLGRDSRYSLKPNDWVEFVDDNIVLNNLSRALLQVEDVNNEDSTVTLKSMEDVTAVPDIRGHAFLRRWDQQDGDADGIAITEGSGDSHWFRIEDGVEIQFAMPGEEEGNDRLRYHTGDYWLIPARTATGDVEWPGSANEPVRALPPQGVDHHYAPLANIRANSRGNITARNLTDLRRLVNKAWS